MTIFWCTGNRPNLRPSSKLSHQALSALLHSKERTQLGVTSSSWTYTLGSLRTERMCWEFKQRSEKPVLPFTSAHSKTVKLGLVRSLLTTAHARSCPHLATHSLNLQLDRLRKAGYPKDLMGNKLDRLRLTTP
ncbi:unnamed protein product, partial [Ixodes pacificus]